MRVYEQADHASVKRKNYYNGGFFMWVITHYLNQAISMYEFETETEAREALKNMKGYKILSEVVYFNDPCFV